MNQDDKVLKAIQDYFDSSSEAKENLSRMFNELKDKSDDDEKSDNEDATEEDEKQKKANNEDNKNSKSDNEDKKEDKDDDEKSDNEDASAEDDKEDEDDDKNDKKASSKTENSYEKIIQKISNSFEQKEKDKLKAYNAVSPILGDFNAFGLSEREILVKGLSSAGVKVSNEKVPELYAMLKVLNSVKIDNSFEYKNQSSSLETVDFNF